MKKTYFIGAAFVSLMVLMSCGKKDSANTAVNQPIQGQYPYTYQSGLPYPNYSGVPGTVGPNCAQGQIRLRGQCYQTQDLAQACQWAAGQLVQTQGGVMCRSERNLGALVNGRLVMVGNFRKDFQINPNLQMGEVLKLYGAVTPNNPNNAWQIQVLQNGAVAGAAQSGAVVSDGDQNVLIYLVNQGNGYGQPVNTNMPVMGAGYVISLYGRGSTYVDLRGTAIACENGFGNLYPCQ